MKKLSRFSCLFAALLLLFATSGCEKKSKTELLTSHIWNWNKLTTTSVDQNIQAIVALANVLMIGATWEFYENGTCTMTPTTGDPQNQTWELSDDENELILDGEAMPIKKLTDDDLILEGEETSDQYGTYLITMYWEK